MIIYIPQNVDTYNTHLKNLVEAYSSKGVEIIVGYETFIWGSVVPDIIHFHHVEGLLMYIKFDEKLFFERLDFYKKSNVKFLYTIHNILPHSKISKLDYSVVFNKFLIYIDLVIHHGEASVGILKKEFPFLSTKRHIVCHHGDYLNDMKNYHESRESARLMLNLPLKKKIILVFGQLQFKNTSFAKEVFEKIKKYRHDSILLMAGVLPLFKYNSLNTQYYKLNNTYLNKFRCNKILIHKRFSQYETYLLFISSDVIFLPHKSGLTTGIIPMAATLGKPFVYPDTGVFKEQAKDCFSVKYERKNVNEASKAIESVLSSGILSFDNSKWLENNNWEKHVEKILLNL